MQQYPHLFTPITIRGHKLKNRLLSAPVGASAFGPSSHLTDYAIDFFEAKAAGGMATVTQGDTPVTYGVSGNMQMAKFNLKEREGFAMLSEFAEAMRQHGSIASVQLNHNGAGQGSEFGCCDGVNEFGQPVRGATVEEIRQTVQLYIDSAKGLKRAGFDMVQIHCGHNWFPHQFLRPTNTRTDEYGGSFENRKRFADEILRGVRAVMGDKAIIEIRVSGIYPEKSPEEFEELVAFINSVEDVVDIVNVSSGGLMLPHDTFGTSFPCYLEPQGINVEKTAALKKRINLPVACLGNIDDPALAEEILASGAADFIEMARPLLADPEWANKARRGEAEDIRPCLQCYKCLDYMHKYDYMSCDVNPELGHEHRLKDIKAPKKLKKLVIVGGGPAGMQAAITAFDRGHKVVLFEKEQALGGLLRMFDDISCKSRVTAYKNWLVRQVTKRGIDLRLGTEATAELIAAEAPDAVFAATGSYASTPSIPGVDGANVFTATEANFNIDKLGKRVCVVGGNMSGCDTSVALLNHGREVTIVTGKLHNEMNFMIADSMDRALEGATIYRNCRAVELTEKGVQVNPMPAPAGGPGMPPMPGGPRADMGPKEPFFVEADSIVLAVGQTANDAFSDEIRFLAPEFAEIGDCREPGSIRSCTRDAYFAALDL